MTVAFGDGPGLLAAFRAAVMNLEAHVDEINALNVFPVPDGDTGSNMLATVRMALEEGEGAAGQSADQISAAISFGALMGARGNSGVITSQILNGLAHGLAGKELFDGRDLARGLTLAAETAYAAVKPPIEGTILTVIRESAEAAVAAAGSSPELEIVLSAAVEEAERSVGRTPELLPILRDAGVVDAGGAGLFRLLEGALRSFRGDAVVESALPSAEAFDVARRRAQRSAPEAQFGYETMFLVQPSPGSELDLASIRSHLETIGESVVVAGDHQAVKVHVHNDRPDTVIGYGLTLGVMSAISVRNLDDQVHVVHAGSDGQMPADRVPPPGHGSRGSRAAQVAPRAHLAIVAVAAGDGLATILRDVGATAVVRGGQAANPSTGELLAAIVGVDADEVILLPNNPNVILAARQAAAAADRPVYVVPSRNAAEGIAALIAHDPTGSAAGNVGPMSDRARSISTLQATTAVRDATIGGRAVRKGETIVLDPDDGLVAADGDPGNAILAAVEALPPDVELISLFYGDGAQAAEAEGLAVRIRQARTHAHVEVNHGGQPHYRYLISAE